MFCPCFILTKTEKINKKVSCSIAVNQQTSLPSKTKAKDQKRVEESRRGRENYMKKIKGKTFKR